MNEPRQKRAVSLVGRDLAGGRPQTRRRTRAFPALVVATLLAGLFLAVLRIDILRLSYALGEALETQQELERESRALTAKVRALRDPARLAELAEQRGFRRPARVIEISRIDSPERP